jgi:hypothetical protein
MAGQSREIVLNCRQMFLLACAKQYLEDARRTFSDEAMDNAVTFAEELAPKMRAACDQLSLRFISVEVQMQSLSQLSTLPLTFKDIREFVDSWCPMGKLSRFRPLQDMLEECCILIFHPLLKIWNQDGLTDTQVRLLALTTLREEYPDRFKRLPSIIRDPYRLRAWEKMGVPHQTSQFYHPENGGN